MILHVTRNEIQNHIEHEFLLFLGVFQSSETLPKSRSHSSLRFACTNANWSGFGITTTEVEALEYLRQKEKKLKIYDDCPKLFSAVQRLFLGNSNVHFHLN